MVSSHPVWSNASFIWPSVAIDLSTLIANLFLAFAVLRQKRRGKWSGMDEIIMAYAITEISLVLIILPLIIAAEYGNDSGSWPGGIYSCSLYQCTVLFSEIASVSFVTVLALERTAVIKRSVANDLAFKIGDLAKARVKIAFVLVIASLFSICPLIKLAPNGFEKGDCQSVFIVSGDGDSSQNKDPGVENEPSHLQHKNEQTLFLLFLMYGYLSFIACIVLYLALIAQLYNLQHRQASDEEQYQEVNAHLMKQEKVATFNRTLTVVIAGAVFYVTWLPSLVVIPLHKLFSSISTETVEICLFVNTLGGLSIPCMILACCKRYRMECIELCSCYRKRANLFVYDNTLNDPSCSTSDSIHFTSSPSGHITKIPYASKPKDSNTNPSLPANSSTQAIDYGFPQNGDNNEDVEYEETTYITHNSDEEDNNVCAAGSQLSLVSSDDDAKMYD